MARGGNAYLVGGIHALDADLPHGVDNGLRAIEDVLVYDLPEGKPLLLREAVLMDDLHLFDNRRFAGFASACVNVQH
jgi:hypothetical protein